MSETDLKNVDIDTALNEAKEAYVATNPKSLARYVEATAVMPGGNTRTVLHYAPFPLAMARAEGCRLWDAKSGEKLDKDRFRRDLGSVIERYREVAGRIGAPL